MILDALRDAALELRLIRRRPGFAALALLTLALGIGAPTAIFSVVQAVLLRPLPYREPDRVVRFSMQGSGPEGPVSFDAIPATMAVAWSSDTATLSALAIWNDLALTLTTSEGPFRLIGASATPNLFELLGVAPGVGRTFGSSDRDEHQIVLSHATWRRFFAANPSLVGTSIVLDGEPYRVTGVMPEHFTYPTPDAAFWVPQVIPPGGQRGMVLPAIARLAPGVTVQAALDEGRRLLGPEDPREHVTLMAETLKDQMVGGVRRVLSVLMAAVCMVFVIATATIALLLLTRGAGRRQEFAVRLAIGAGRGRLVRQLLVEALTLAALGGVLGLSLAGSGLALFERFAPKDLPRLQEVSIDGRALLFCAALCVLTSLVFGALSAGRAVTLDALRSLAGAAESRLVGGAVSRRRLSFLAGTELAVTLVLLVGAALLLRSFVGLILVPQGFDARNARAMGIHLPSSRYPTGEARAAFLARLLEELRRDEELSAVGVATSMPNRQATGRFSYNPVGVPLHFDPASMQVQEVRMVSEGFLEAMGVPLRAGRTFTREDVLGAESVIVISEQMARQQFPDRDPIGHMLFSQSGNRRVVGVVADVSPAQAGGKSAPAAYLPLWQALDVLDFWSGLSVVARGKNAPPAGAALRAQVLSLDPEMPPSNLRTLREEVSSYLAGPRFSASVLGLFAFLALVMAALGVYGVMAYSTRMRTHEIGVRVALGATKRDVLRLVLRDGVALLCGGLGVGLLAAIALAHTLAGLLYGVRPADPATFACVSVLLSGVGLLAACVPAWRATRLDVLEALREP